MKVFALLSVFTLTACNEKIYNGKISLQQPIQLINKDKKPVSLSAGEIKAQIKIAKKDRIDLILEQNDKTQKVPMKVNFSIENIQSGEKIYIPAHVSGQLYNLSGDYQMDVEETGSSTYKRSCSYNTNPHKVCRIESPPACKDPKTKSKCTPLDYRQVCETEYDTFKGHQYVTSYDRITTHTYKLDILDSNNNNLGQIVFGETYTRDIVTNETKCE